MDPVHVLIDKQARRLFLMQGNRIERSYPVTLGRSAADKQREGDDATPVGEFYVCAKNPQSRYFLSLCLSYPRIEDADRGLAAHLIDAQEHQAIVAAHRTRSMPPQHTRLGGEIYIHGHARDVAAPDATRGCIALHNEGMRAVYDTAVLGMVVRIIAIPVTG